MARALEVRIIVSFRNPSYRRYWHQWWNHWYHIIAVITIYRYQIAMTSRGKNITSDRSQFWWSAHLLINALRGRSRRFLKTHSVADHQRRRFSSFLHCETLKIMPAIFRLKVNYVSKVHFNYTFLFIKLSKYSLSHESEHNLTGLFYRRASLNAAFDQSNHNFRRSPHYQCSLCNP